MNLKVILPPGQAEITVNGLHQWDYGRKLEIHSNELPANIEVHFACSGMTEAVVRNCAVINGVATADIPNHCIEQTTPIVAWVYYIDDTSGRTERTIIMPIIARTRPAPTSTVPTIITDKYTQLVGAINEQIGALASGNVTAGRALEANHATTADSATTAGRATTAGHSTTADTARNLMIPSSQAVVDKEVNEYVGYMVDGITEGLYLAILEYTNIEIEGLRNFSYSSGVGYIGIAKDGEEIINHFQLSNDNFIHIGSSYNSTKVEMYVNGGEKGEAAGKLFKLKMYKLADFLAEEEASE